MMSPLTRQNQTDIPHNLKVPLALIRAHSEHLLAAYDHLSTPQRVALLEAIHAQTILLEYLLDGLTKLPPTDIEAAGTKIYLPLVIRQG
jgi:K+-sensing histidine kinase KdpD